MKLVGKREIKKKIVINEIGLFIQSVLIVCAVALGIMTVFESTFAITLEFVLALALFTMAYNNTKIFKRKLFTIPYIIGGIICILSGIVEITKVF